MPHFLPQAQKILPLPLSPLPILIALVYCWFCYTYIGLRSDHILISVLATTAYYIHPKTRHFVSSFFIYLLYWAIYDTMRILPNYRYNRVHIAELYNTEKAIFGINIANGDCLTPCEYFAQHAYPILDALGGLFYIAWVPVPVTIAAYLWYKDEKAFKQFTYIFLGANFIGFAIYYLYPAAPPWYVALYGFELHEQVASNAAGLARFDLMFNVSLFKGMYGMGANVFAAMPSLHSANPAALLFFGWNYFNKYARPALLCFGLGIWFSAVYLNHHYILDVLAGIACAALSYSIVQFSAKRWQWQ